MSLDVKRLERTYTIRQLCAEFQVTPRALRFYEDKGLLAPTRDGVNRVYHQRDRTRLSLVLRGKRVGLSLAEISETLDLYRIETGGAAQMARALDRLRRRIVGLEAQSQDIAATVAELRDVCARLEAQLAAPPPDVLPKAADYDTVLRARLDDAHAFAVKPS